MRRALASEQTALQPERTVRPPDTPQGFSTMNLMVTPVAPGRSRVTFRLLTTIDSKFIRCVSRPFRLHDARRACSVQRG